MKRIIAVVLALVCALSLFACGGGADAQPKDVVAIKDKIIADLAIEGAIEVQDKEMLLNTYGIAVDDIESFACFSTMTGAFPDEVIMVNAVDEDAAARVESMLNTHLVQVLVQSKNYDAENYKLAQECKVITSGTTVALFISANHAQMEEIFNAA